MKKDAELLRDIKKIKYNKFDIQTVKDLRNALDEYSGDYMISFEVGDIDDVLSPKEQEDYDAVDECESHTIQIVDFTDCINHKSLTLKVFKN